MRGTPDRQLSMLSSLSTEDLIPADHPIRRIRVVVDTVLADLDDTFEAMYSSGGRPAVRSERAFCERLNYDMCRRSRRTAVVSSMPTSRTSSSLRWFAKRSWSETVHRRIAAAGHVSRYSIGRNTEVVPRRLCPLGSSGSVR